jgi:hypothetical protein
MSMEVFRGATKTLKIEGSGLEGYCWMKLEVHDVNPECRWITMLRLRRAKVIRSHPVSYMPALA